MKKLYLIFGNVIVYGGILALMVMLVVFVWQIFVATCRGGEYQKYNTHVCEWCGEKEGVEVHHIMPQHLAPEFKNDPKNLISLCRDCHFVIGHKRNFKTGYTTNIVLMIQEGKR